MTRYALREFKLPSLFRLSFVVGAAAGVFPSLIASLLIMRAVSAFRRFLESMKNVSQPLPILNSRITFDFVSLFQQSDTLHNLKYIDSHAWFFGPALFFVIVLAFAICAGIAATTAAIVYNGLAKRIGGVEIEIEEVRPRR